MKTLIASAAIVLATTSAIPVTYAQGLMLRPGTFDSQTLVQELGPARPAGTRTRNLNVRPAGATGTSKQGAASLLITFETNSAEITGPSAQALDIVAQALNDSQLAPYQFRIEGHADPRGPDEYNTLLSQARAESVVNYLVTNHGIAAARLNADGRGESEVLHPNNPRNPENRRVTILRMN